MRLSDFLIVWHVNRQVVLHRDLNVLYLSTSRGTEGPSGLLLSVLANPKRKKGRDVEKWRDLCTSVFIFSDLILLLLRK